MRRREFLKLIATSTGASVLGSSRAGSGSAERGRRLFVLAFDGMDPVLVKDLMAAGRLPHFKRLAEMGSFKRIATSTPAQTPVAFSNIISGADPGTHQIYDFIHRDPNPTGAWAVQPQLSTSGTLPPESERAISLGQWRIPLAAGQTQLLRRGDAFWNHLVRHGVDTTVYYIPSNYPPQTPVGKGRFRCISGMGTPDLQGGFGTFTLFTPDAPFGGRKVTGGVISYWFVDNHRAKGSLPGPKNFLHKSGKDMRFNFEIVRDPEAHVAMIEIAGHKILLKSQEWSPWIAIDFETGIPGSVLLDAAGAPTAARGMVRFFLKQVHPKLELYASPVNIDPIAPINQISVPPEFARQLAKRHGRFYTAGIPEDTKALTHGVLNEDEFLSQCHVVMDERRRQYRQALREFESGCLFFYFGETDLVQHMFWRDRDADHPGRDPRQGDQYGHVIDDLYVTMDGVVGEALAELGPDDTIMVLSDHGFNTFRRGFNLNTWLVDNGYIRLSKPLEQEKHEYFTNVNWQGTRAYGVGMNGLYLNEVGREKYGAVPTARRRGLLAEIADKLMQVRDDDGSQVIRNIYLTQDLYTGADPNIAPDLLVGYAGHYRASWSTVLGGMPRKLIEDNMDRWSGTHLIEADLVPGILFSNRQVVVKNPDLLDIAPSILGVFGIEKPTSMRGQSLFA